jgi:NADH-quinone oxidoreductase subunit H
LVLLPAFTVAAGAIAWAFAPEGEGMSRTARAAVTGHLALFTVWATLLLIAGGVARRGVRSAFDHFVASIGDPRGILFAGIAGHVLVVLVGLVSRGTPAGAALEQIGYGSGTLVFAVTIVLGAAYIALGMRGQKRIGLRALGLLHVLADGLKLAFKEDVVPARADRLLYGLGPVLALFPALAVLGVVPFGDTLCFAVSPVGTVDWGTLVDRVPREGVCTEGSLKLMVVDPNVGILYVFALAGTAAVGMAIAGWSSDNKFSLLGGLRAASQVISYEVTLGLAAMGALMIYGTLQLDTMVRWQATHTWGVFVQPLGCLLFFAAAMVESKRVPFDLPEGESEIVAGYFTEYSGMKFAMFYFAEYAAVVVIAVLMTTLFFGGWHVPFLDRDGLRVALGPSVWFEQPLPHGLVVLLGVGAFLLKTLLLCWLQVAIRWTLPRLRFDQLMRFGWRMLLPASLVNVLATGVALLWLDGAEQGLRMALVRWAASLAQLAVMLAAFLAVTSLVIYWIRPAQKARSPMTSAVRLAAALGGTPRSRMGA